jgi:hypothetical protein
MDTDQLPRKLWELHCTCAGRAEQSQTANKTAQTMLRMI